MTDNDTPESNEELIAERISAAMDDALDERETAMLLDRLADDPSLQDQWTRWHSVTSALRADVVEILLHHGDQIQQPHLAGAVLFGVDGSLPPSELEVHDGEQDHACHQDADDIIDQGMHAALTESKERRDRSGGRYR